ncbi:hypothetical protein Tco_0950593 [Tanacetum coccineum]
MDVAIHYVADIEDSDGFGYGSGRNMNFWNFDRDILRDILGHNSLPWDHTSACHPSCIFVNESFEFIHKNDVIEIDVATTGGNNGFWFGVDMGLLRETDFEKDFIIEDFESFIGSFVKEDSSGV